MVCNERGLSQPCKKTCLDNSMCPLSARALLQIFNYSIEAHSPPYFSLANKASRSSQLLQPSRPLLKRYDLLKKKMQKREAEGLIWLIGAASVKCVAGPEGAGQWVGSKHPGWLEKHWGRLLTVANLIRGLVRGGLLQCSLLECVSTKTLEGLWSLLVHYSHVRPRAEPKSVCTTALFWH